MRKDLEAKQSSKLLQATHKRLSVLNIRTPAQWRAWSSATRVEITDAMLTLGPCSLSQIARLMDRPAASLYHHVQALQKAGLVTVTGRRRAGRTMETVYDRVADQFLVPIAKPRNRAEREYCARFSQVYHRMIGKSLTDSMNAGILRISPKKNYGSGWERAWLTESEVQQIFEHLRGIGKIIYRDRSTKKGAPYLFGFTFCPTVRPRRR